MWIKICGITNLEDARVAVDAGADALGFVFYEKSPRKVNVETAGNIVAQLPQRLEKVGVFVDPTAEQIRETTRRTGLSAVQIHQTGNDEQSDGATGVLARPAAVAQALASEDNRDDPGATKVILAISGDQLSNGVAISVTDYGQKGLYAVLVDSGHATVPGGTGRTFDWRQARGMVQTIGRAVPVIVAGGLNAKNVTEALQLFQPFGVDVSSGVEARPGKKDPEKVRAFVQAVRQAGKKE